METLTLKTLKPLAPYQTSTPEFYRVDRRDPQIGLDGTTILAPPTEAEKKATLDRIYRSDWTEDHDNHDVLEWIVSGVWNRMELPDSCDILHSDMPCTCAFALLLETMIKDHLDRLHEGNPEILNLHNLDLILTGTPYLHVIYHDLSGSGIGMGDGRWDRFFDFSGTTHDKPWDFVRSYFTKVKDLISDTHNQFEEVIEAEILAYVAEEI